MVSIRRYVGDCGTSWGDDPATQYNAINFGVDSSSPQEGKSSGRCEHRETVSGEAMMGASASLSPVRRVGVGMNWTGMSSITAETRGATGYAITGEQSATAPPPWD